MKSGVLKENSSVDFSICYFIRRFNIKMKHEMPNKTSEGVHQRWEYMYFWSQECTGKNHDLNEEVLGKVKIHDFVKNPAKVGL